MKFVIFKLSLIFLCLCFFVTNAQEQDYSAIDKYVKNTPKSIKRTEESLAIYLTKPAKNDHEKARAFYTWIALNIKYDVDAFFKGTNVNCTSEGVLKSKKTVCQGYATLFKKLCDEVGIKSYVISGYSKGFGYDKRKSLDKTNHAWNAVNLDNKWYLLDVTWGAGYINERSRYVQNLSYAYFLSKPSTFIYKHLPEDPMWQLLDCPIKANDFLLDSLKIKPIVDSLEFCFNYQDSIAVFDTLSDKEQLLKTAENAYQYNVKNSAKLGYAYMVFALDLIKNIENLSKEEMFDKFNKALQYLEFAKMYLEKSATKNAKNNLKICKENITILKRNLKSLERR